MGVFRQFPYSNFHEMNMDEIIKIVKNMLEEWAQYYATWDAWMAEINEDWSNYQEVMNEAWQDMQDFINNYFDNLDVQNEINNKINDMKNTGELSQIIQPFIPPEVTSWLATHITEPTGVVIDTSLTVEGACADAKATGDAIRELTDTLAVSFDLVRDCENCYINRFDHEEVESNNWLTSDYIPVKAGQSYYLTASAQPDSGYDSTLNTYNEEYTFLGVSYSNYDNTEWIALRDGYIRVTNYSSTEKPKCVTDTTRAINFRLEDLETETTELNENLDDVTETLISNEDLVGNCSSIYFNRYNHAEVSAPGYRTSDFIPVKKDEVYYLTANVRPGFGYDSSLNVYDTSYTFKGFTASTYDNTPYTALQDGYIRVTSYGDAKPKCIASVNHVVANIAKLENEFNNLADKTILWLGTSIPAGQKTTEVTVDGITTLNNYPKMIGELLGCTVINNALGTSCIKTGKPEKVTEADPMGVQGVQFEIATRALTETLSEKNDFVNNWSTKYAPGCPLALWDAPNTLPQYQIDIILNSSYETLLVPYLDGTYPMPDYFVFDHGYNDGSYYNASTGEQMSEIPSDPNDRHYFVGAYNMLIRLILSSNPKAKIILIDHFCSQDRPWVIDAQDVVSEEWEFPTCELYKISGISMQEITVEGVTKTVKQVYCPDGTHPHSDTTGGTNMMLASKIARWLKMIA